MSESAMIAMAGVSVQFASIRALADFSLEVAAGELVALTGPNGAGKSTALRVIIGQIRPQTGKATIAGRQASDAKKSFGYMPDKDNHFDEFTARRNLQFFGALYGASGSRADECLRIVRLEESADRAVGAFSLGMRRRLLLARALLHQPRALILDEPMANLDENGVAVVADVLQRARAVGTAVLLTAHRRDQISLCDREIRLVDGRIDQNSR
jgi:ABC-type multidrug transport system ATPase subunit